MMDMVFCVNCGEELSQVLPIDCPGYAEWYHGCGNLIVRWYHLFNDLPED